MRRLFRTLILTACALLMVASSALAFKLDSYKATWNGNVVNVQMKIITEYERDSAPMAIFNSSGKQVRGIADEEAIYEGKSEGGHNVYSFSHKFNLAGLPSGTYIARDTRSGLGFKFKFTARPALYYKGTKVMTSSDGELMQRLNFNQYYTKGKELNVKIYDQYGECVKSFSLVSSGKKYYYVSWNGWADTDAAEKCPNGIYTAKYWIEGHTPKTVKFRLSL